VLGDGALEGFVAALLPLEAGGPDPASLRSRMDRFLGHDAATGRLARVALRLGALGVEGFALATTGRRLASLPQPTREAVLERLGASRLAGGGLEGMKAAALLVHGAERHAHEILAAASSTEPARPDPPLDVTPALGWPSRRRVDAVVVGSGAGGAMVARTLARHGLEVVVVEEGRRFGVEEFRTGHPLDRFAALYRDGGATAALGLPPVVLPIGRGVGGTTLVNSGTCYRTPRRVLERWRDEHGLELADPDVFGPYLDDVWSTLQVGPVPLEVMGRNGLLALQGAKALGWAARPLDRNAPGCGGCCQCAIGCPRNAKFGVHLNALPEACAAGARIVSEARVERVLAPEGRATGIVARRRDGSRLVVEAPIVVVAAGSTETPPLLRRSGLGRHPRLGRNLALHPAVGVAGRFVEPVVAWHGVLQSAGIEELHETRGILAEATSTPPGMGTMILPGVGRRLLEEIEGADHLATLGAMVADAASGSVLGRRRALVRYDLAREDARRLLEAIGMCGRVLFAAGAREVLTGIASAPVVRDERALDEAIAHADVRSLHVAAFHPVGTAAAGSDPERHPVDPQGRLRGARGVFVADGSVLPTCPEVNPQVTIMAMAMAIAETIAAA
jgi:choline dehydrogenase-like flavoprotein